MEYFPIGLSPAIDNELKNGQQRTEFQVEKKNKNRSWPVAKACPTASTKPLLKLFVSNVFVYPSRNSEHTTSCHP